MGGVEGTESRRERGSIACRGASDRSAKQARLSKARWASWRTCPPWRECEDRTEHPVVVARSLVCRRQRSATGCKDGLQRHLTSSPPGPRPLRIQIPNPTGSSSSCFATYSSSSSSAGLSAETLPSRQTPARPRSALLSLDLVLDSPTLPVQADGRPMSLAAQWRKRQLLEVEGRACRGER